MSSRWAISTEEGSRVPSERKRKKEEKRKQKEEKQLQQNAQKFTSKTERSTDAQGLNRPAKRQRTISPSQDAHKTVQLLEFPNFSFERSRSSERYQILNDIEEGSYGYVSRAQDKNTGEIVALKRLKIADNLDGFPVTGLREIETLKACSHEHIVKLREVVVDDSPKQDVYIVMDFLEHDLKTVMEDMVEPFQPSEVKTLMQQLCSATEYLHSNWIIHRDLKTSNILLNNRGQIKLADFGMARYTSDPRPKLTQLVVTLWYRAPELLLGAEEYHFEIDVWSIGCIFAELLTRDPLFQGKNEVKQLSNIFDLLGTPSLKSWPDFRLLPNAKALHPLLSSGTSRESKLTSTKFPDLKPAGLTLMRSLLALNPDDRPTASDALTHLYFKEDPRPKPTEMFPTFPSKAGREKRRRRPTPQAPDRGRAPRIGAEDFAGIFRG